MTLNLRRLGDVLVEAVKDLHVVVLPSQDNGGHQRGYQIKSPTIARCSLERRIFSR